MLWSSLELSRQDSSNDGHIISFYGKIWKIVPKLSLFKENIRCDPSLEPYVFMEK